MKEVKNRSGCPVSCSLDIWGDKWSLLIIRDLMLNKQRTYGEFLNADEGISTNILAARLLALEENSLITKSPNPRNRSSTLYTLTQKGIDLLPTLVEIHLWADKHLDISDDKKSLLQDIKRDKEAFIKKSKKYLQS